MGSSIQACIRRLNLPEVYIQGRTIAKALEKGNIHVHNCTQQNTRYRLGKSQLDWCMVILLVGLSYMYAVRGVRTISPDANTVSSP